MEKKGKGYGITVPDGWLNLISNFVLLSKKEIKAIVEVD
jgi:hypothetical protein